MKQSIVVVAGYASQPITTPTPPTSASRTHPPEPVSRSPWATLSPDKEHLFHILYMLWLYIDTMLSIYLYIGMYILYLQHTESRLGMESVAFSIVLSTEDVFCPFFFFFFFFFLRNGWLTVDVMVHHANAVPGPLLHCYPPDV